MPPNKKRGDMDSKNNLPLSLRFALRELRGGVSGFWIFLACLALGVAAIAGAGSLNEAFQTGITEDAQFLLGGDAQAQLSYRQATSEEMAVLRSAGEVSYVMRMRSMARSTNQETGNVRARTLIELKAVDDYYPLYGELELDPPIGLRDALALENGIWGAAIDPHLLSRLGIQVGETISVGEAKLKVRAVVRHEPDRVITFATSGPRVMIASEAMGETELVQEGSLITRLYNVRFNGNDTAASLRSRLHEQFPDAGFRVRGLNQAAQGLQSFLDNVTLFLTLVGLTALLTGGIGVANAVKAYLDGRINTIATLKCLGAPGDLIFRIYLVQLAALASLGILIGLFVGSLIPFTAAQIIGDMLPIEARFGFYAKPTIKAAVFGLLMAAVFALWPLARAREVPAVALFRSLVAHTRLWPQNKYVFVLAGIAAVLAAFTILTAEHPRFAVFFVLGAAAALLLFRFAASFVMKLAARLTAKHGGVSSGRPTLRLALVNLYRPGSPTTSVVLSLGLGLSVLVTIALLEANLNAQINGRLPDEVPSMFFIDIQPHQTEQFEAAVNAVPGVEKVQLASMIRGRISKIGGVPTNQVKIDPDARWIVRGERGISQSAIVPENSRIVKGTWWSTDHDGENLLSLDVRAADGMGLDVGDTLSVTILGREITARIANLRDIRWQRGTMNFALIYSPNSLRGAPGMYIGTVHCADGAEEVIEAVVVDTMPNITTIQVREALEILKEVLQALGVAVRITALVALVAGVLVLSGAIAAGHARRIYESVVLKVLGATRADVLKAFIFEYCLLGFSTGIIAAVVGSVAAWTVTTYVMDSSWMMFPVIVANVIFACIAVTLIAGFAGTWRALGIKAAPMLRND